MENEGEKIVSFKMPKPKKTVETLRSNVSVPSGNVSNLNGVVSNSADADVSPQTVAPEALQCNVSTVYREGQLRSAEFGDDCGGEAFPERQFFDVGVY